MKKLKHMKFKNSLTKSKVKTVKVNVGKAKANKTYVKKYKKVFAKKACGKSVRVRL